MLQNSEPYTNLQSPRKPKRKRTRMSRNRGVTAGSGGIFLAFTKNARLPVARPVRPAGAMVESLDTISDGGTDAGWSLASGSLGSAAPLKKPIRPGMGFSATIFSILKYYKFYRSKINNSINAVYETGFWDLVSGQVLAVCHAWLCRNL
jgi:hypothetical protein